MNCDDIFDNFVADIRDRNKSEAQLAADAYANSKEYAINEAQSALDHLIAAFDGATSREIISHYGDLDTLSERIENLRERLSLRALRGA